MVKKKKPTKNKVTIAHRRVARKKAVKVKWPEKKAGTSGTGPRLCGDDNEA
jgi:hypothetical protein